MLDPVTERGDARREVVILTDAGRSGADALDGASDLTVWVGAGVGGRPDEWELALDRLERRPVVVAVVSVASAADEGWRRLVGHALALQLAVLVVAADDTPLAKWPVALLDARPPIVDAADTSWRASLLAIVRRVDAGPTPPGDPPARPAATGDPHRRPAARGGSAPTLQRRSTTTSSSRCTGLRPLHRKRGTCCSSSLTSRSSTGRQGGTRWPRFGAKPRRCLGEAFDRYGKLVDESAGPIRRGSDIVIEPFLAGATFNPPTVSFRWEEPVHRADFRFKVMADTGSRVRGGVRVFVGAVVVGEVTFSVRVGEAAPGDSVDVDHTRRFRRVFASYAHDDAEVVLTLADAAKVLGVDYVIDVRDLRSGDDWRHRIHELIEHVDTFQLFWSSNALQSPYVLEECRHALSLGREGFIQPVYWEEPLLLDPDRDAPPPAITRLHFSKLAGPERRSAPLPPPPPPAPPATATGARRATTGRRRPPAPAPRVAARSRRSWVAGAAAAVLVAAGAAVTVAQLGRSPGSANPDVTPTAGKPPPTAIDPTDPPGTNVPTSCSWADGYLDAPSSEQRAITAAQPSMEDLTRQLVLDAQAQAGASPPSRSSISPASGPARMVSSTSSNSSATSSWCRR